MTEPPPLPAQPLEYFNPNDAPPGRPASVLVVAILAIIFGCYSSLGLLSSAFMLIGGFAGGFPRVNSSPSFIMVYALESFVGGILGVTLLVGGILALSLNPLGRRLLIFYAIAHWILGSIGTICMYLVFLPRVVSTATTSINGKVIAVAVSRPATISPMWIIAIPNLALILLWSLVILIVTTRSRVKSAFVRVSR